MPDPAPSAVQLDVLRFATIPTPHDYVFRPASPWRIRWWTAIRPGADAIDSPALAFIVRHPTEGVTLVDTGQHPDRRDSSRDDGPLMRLVFARMRAVGPAYGEQLRDHGIDPDTVERVVMTHLHVDHTSGMRLLPAATFHLTPQEWRAARGRRAALEGYVAHHLPPEDRVRTLDLLAAGVAHGPLRHTHDLFGDGSVRLAFTPGHTTGHLSVLLQTADHGEVLLVGDAAYTRRSIRDGHLPLLTADDDASRDSLRQLRDFAAWHPDATIVPTHDPDAWRELERPS